MTRNLLTLTPSRSNTAKNTNIHSKTEACESNVSNTLACTCQRFISIALPANNGFVALLHRIWRNIVERIERQRRFYIWFDLFWFPFPEGDGSGPNSTALQCRDDPWHRSEWTRVIPADVQKSAWKSLAPMGPAPAFKPTRTDTTLWS